MIKRRQNWH